MALWSRLLEFSGRVAVPLPTLPRLFVRGATKKSTSVSKNGRDSAGRRLGLKVGNRERVRAGQVLIRQRGTKWLPGGNVGLGRDHTIYALRDGLVAFTRNRAGRSVVNLEVPVVEEAEVVATAVARR
ncbi:hypothetical protein CDCA_CDCA05G1484 [Cyanidium caldarium]|uniref:50S ribosomal protein L27 n=1 Tax=Cyanidium caldarium TaxID=2771 RepID=A0AAV9ITH5_CYACA|nr:hypothetical protein CDCA_CDCA05G1484 [Cyanidium caldarium]